MDEASSWANRAAKCIHSLPVHSAFIPFTIEWYSIGAHNFLSATLEPMFHYHVPFKYIRDGGTRGREASTCARFKLTLRMDLRWRFKCSTVTACNRKTPPRRRRGRIGCTLSRQNDGASERERNQNVERWPERAANDEYIYQHSTHFAI